MVSTLSLKEDLSFSHEGPFFLSQRNTEEQNSQRPTETLSQPKTQSVTANVSWKASVISVCRRRSVGSKLCAKRLSELCALCERKKYPQWVTCVSSFREGTFYFSQIYTEEQNTQWYTETLSQPISQSVTANVSWKASVISVCRRRSVGSKCAPKGSVNSVRSVREKNSPANLKRSFSHGGCVLILTEKHRWTEHTAFHRDIKSTDFTEPYSHL